MRQHGWHRLLTGRLRRKLGRKLERKGKRRLKQRLRQSASGTRPRLRENASKMKRRLRWLAKISSPSFHLLLHHHRTDRPNSRRDGRQQRMRPQVRSTTTTGSSASLNTNCRTLIHHRRRHHLLAASPLHLVRAARVRGSRPLWVATLSGMALLTEALHSQVNSWRFSSSSILQSFRRSFNFWKRRRTRRGLLESLLSLGCMEGSLSHLRSEGCAFGADAFLGDARDAREGALRGAARADATFVRAPRDIVST